MAAPRIHSIVMISPKVASAGPVMLSGSYPFLNTKKTMMIVIRVNIIPDIIHSKLDCEIHNYYKGTDVWNYSCKWWDPEWQDNYYTN